MSKGSRQRPTDKAKFDANYDLIFGKNRKTDSEKFDEKVVMKDEFYDLEDADLPKDSKQNG